jgi:hypothetical protein
MAHSMEVGLIYRVVGEQIMAERRASWSSVWDDIASEAWKTNRATEGTSDA